MASASYDLLKITPMSKTSRFEVEEISYRVLDENRKTYTIRPAGDFIVIIPRIQDKIILVEAISPPHPKLQLIFPTGFVTAGKPLADIAQSILIDNLGMVATNYIYLGKIKLSKYINAIAHVLVGENLHHYQDKFELLKDRVKLYTEKEIGQLLMNCELDDGLTLSSYCYYVTSKYYWTEVHNAALNPNRSS